MKVKCFAKINWSLFIKGILENGYHDLDMLMQPISLFDQIDIEQSDTDVLYVNGINIKDKYENLCFKAVKQINNATSNNFSYIIKLEKNIPMGAGLGGGSSDAAAIINALNIMHNYKLSQKKLLKIALSVGSDVPFMINGGFCRVSGTGEKIEKLNYKNKLKFLLIFDDVHLSTQKVFQNYIHSNNNINNTDFILHTIIKGNFIDLRNISLNSLLDSANNLNSKVGEIIDECYKNGATLSSMTGSGSAVFAIFENDVLLNKAFEIISKKRKLCKILETVEKPLEIIEF